MGLAGALVLIALALVLWRPWDREAPQGPPPTPGPFVRSIPPAEVWAVGDAAGGQESADEVAAVIRRAQPDRLLYLGDVYEEGTAEEFERHYDPLYGELAAITAPTPGNHEWSNRELGYYPYWRRVKSVTRVPDFYSFSIGGWQVISLNSNQPDDPRQLRWLGRQLRGPGNCRLAFWHRPRFSAGTLYGDDPSVEPLWRAVRGRAALVVVAHEHNMQRFRPIGGTTLLVSGAGGHSRYAMRPADRRVTFADDDHDGALRLRLAPGRADTAFVDRDGRTLDRAGVSCRQD